MLRSDDESQGTVLPGPLERVFAVPVGDHGVLLAGSTGPLDHSPAQRDLAHLIAENLDAALERADTEAALRERDRRLKRKNRSLEQLTRLDGIIRSINQSAIRSTTTGEIKEAVCEQFADDDKYAFAWISPADPDEHAPSFWSGLDPEFVDHLGTDETTPLSDLIEEARVAETVTAVGNILEDAAWESERSDALRYGYRSIAAVPISVRNHVESVLVIHGADADLFDDRERTVLEELGRTIGYALRNVNRVQAVASGDRVEVEVEIPDDRLLTNRITEDGEVAVDFVGAIPGTEDRLRTFLRLRNADGVDVPARLGSLQSIESVQTLSEEGATGLYQLAVVPPPLVRILERNDARLRDLSAADGVTTVTTVQVGDADVRTLLDDLQEAYPGTALVARRRDTTPVETQEGFREQVLADLTEKQLDALQTAHYGGFFEWPRVSNSEELAGTRDIAPSTFQHHLRAAERKVVSAVLEPA
jgi:GAF domain-containing protein